MQECGLLLLGGIKGNEKDHVWEFSFMALNFFITLMLF